MTTYITLRNLITAVNERKNYEEQLDATEIATEIFILRGTEDYGRNIFLDLEDGEVFTQEKSLSSPEKDSIIFIGRTKGEFDDPAYWRCEPRYEILLDEDGEEYEGDFLGYTCDDQNFFSSREEAIEAEIRRDGLDAENLEETLDIELEFDDGEIDFASF